MIRKVLVVVPHPDDEINLAGGLYDIFKTKNIYTSVVFCTNGDFYPEYSIRRHKEVLNAKKILGYDEAVFLGYGDGMMATHVYNIDGDVTIKSNAGKVETYTTGVTPEYCYQRYRIHHKYTRNNLKNDIKDVVLDKRADLIICVDLDCHYDHRCVSLLFDEAMGEILKEHNDYRPIILKGFAYMGSWAGMDDFFSSIVKPMIPTINRTTIDPSCTYPFNWKDRIRVRNSQKATKMLLWKNSIFKALLAHRSQMRFSSVPDNAFVKFPSIANPESCYWLRRADNLVLQSRVHATSGNINYLNDFKIFDTTGLHNNSLYDYECGWIPSSYDTSKEITIDFSTKKKISYIKIFQGYKSDISHIKLTTFEGDSYDYLFNNPGNTLNLSVNLYTSLIKIHIIESRSIELCIHEIECYQDKDDNDWILSPLNQYIESPLNNPIIITQISGFLFHLVARLLLMINSRHGKKTPNIHTSDTEDK